MGRRGKPPKNINKREPNGRASRKPKDVMEQFLADMSKEDRDVQGAALSARHRVFGVDPRHSRDQKAGSAVGRYCLQGLISQEQYDAAMQFVESYGRHLRAIDAPKPHAGAIDINATRGRPVFTENVDQLDKWQADYDNALKAVFAKQYEIRLNGNLYGALYAVLIRDVMLDTLLGDLRTGLNALVKHYGLLARVAA